MHCAAQRYEGVLSIFIFNRCHKITIKSRDRKGSTALHFAVTSMHIKNVQAFIKLGADVNAQDADGNTCLHLCIKTMADKIDFKVPDEEDYEETDGGED